MAQRSMGRAQARPISFPLTLLARPALSLLAIAVLLVGGAQATRAHDGGPRLILEPQRVSPGGVVVIRGEDLGSDHELRIALIGGGTEADLATVTSDGQGHFTIAVQISNDAPTGGYAITATGSDGSSLRAPMIISGAPVSDGQGAPPGQDEGLPNLAATPASQASPGRIATVESLPPRALASSAAGSLASVPSSGASSELDLVPLVALVGAVAALSVLFWRTRRPRGSAESADLS
jgi:hypothetical protein